MLTLNPRFLPVSSSQGALVGETGDVLRRPERGSSWKASLSARPPRPVVVYLSPRLMGKPGQRRVSYVARIRGIGEDSIDSEYLGDLERSIQDPFPQALPPEDHKEDVLRFAQRIADYGANRCGHNMDVYLVHRNPRRPTEFELEYLVRQDPKTSF